MKKVILFCSIGNLNVSCVNVCYPLIKNVRMVSDVTSITSRPHFYLPEGLPHPRDIHWRVQGHERFFMFIIHLIYLGLSNNFQSERPPNNFIYDVLK